MYQGIFVDAAEADKHFAELMSSKGRYGLRVEFQKPDEMMTLAKEILSSQPDLVALNYRLNNNRKKRPSNYKAGALAQQLRDSVMESVSKDFPIILVSSQDDIKAFFDNVTAHNLFDRCFSKEELELGNGGLHSEELLSLVKGYKHLIKNWNQPERWSIFLGITGQERLRISYQAIRELDKLKAPHQVARDILRYVIDRPGLLLDKENLLAELGVAETGKDVDALLEILRQEKVLYTGIFSEGWTRWWSHRLDRWGEKLCNEALGNLTAKQRTSCLNKKLGLKLSPAKSRWQGHTNALFAFACVSCHQPTEEEFSVAVYDPLPLPYTFAQSKYICWKCVETGEFEEKGFELDESEEFIVDKIQNGEFRK
ncbi:MAG: hypothetical protein DRR08_28725 [Candidatus Parabeggiatoa sp. nov. 2]|nr:MAG: hypothetical protein B6247_27735 [Beggiatoa sp. 4572_84]RKZ52003.1 MAG: hypothetical protein DRR08_28725 [Gammaproteobacteria bacterium]HEC85582.1 hypothetical protein [Thioploca sp.]